MLSCASFGLVQTKAKTPKPCIEFAYEIYSCGEPRSKKEMCHIIFPFSETVVFLCVYVYILKIMQHLCWQVKRHYWTFLPFFPLPVFTPISKMQSSAPFCKKNDLYKKKNISVWIQAPL